MKWDVVIGLEIHCQLNTKSKLFCSCKISFGERANANTCPICMGHPGVLPIFNREVLKKAILTGYALNCKIQTFSQFDRKNYFYPDLPKAYQITQYEKPICLGGHIAIEVQPKNGNKFKKIINLTRIHIEEDAGKLIHSLGDSLIDLNRSGVPLLEIVSEPDMNSSLEAITYFQTLKNVLKYIGVSDCNMEQGNLRADANVSLKPKGSQKLGDRTEIKNMNSFKFLQTAIDYEIKRQSKILESGDKIITQTLLFDPESGKTKPMRFKEESHDYRYFPEPDLLPISIDETELSLYQSELNELPDKKKERFIRDFNLSEYDANVLSSDGEIANYFDECLKTSSASPKKIANWIMTEVMSALNEKNQNIKNFKISPETLGKLVELIEKGEITGKIAKEIFSLLLETKQNIETIIKEKNLKVISNDSELKDILREIIDKNPLVVEKYKSGNTKVLSFFIGQAMKKTKGQGNPTVLNKLLKNLLN